MAEPKTRPTAIKASTWLAAIDDEARRKDCARLIAMMKRATGEPPVLWGGSIVGFGRYLASYASGKQLDWPVVAFASRGTGLVLYIMTGFTGAAARLRQLGPHRTGKSCLYVKRLSDLDLEVLQSLIDDSVRAMAPKRLRPTSSRAASGTRRSAATARKAR